MAAAKGQKSGKSGIAQFRLGNGGALLQYVVENAAVPTFLAGADGKLAYANRAFADILGYDKNQCIGLGLGDIIHPDEAAAARSQIEGVFDGGADGYQAERRYLRKDGDAVWVLASALVVPAGRRRPRLLSVQAVDIDRQKRAELALSESERRWNVALESAGQGVWDHDLSQNSAFYSPMWKEMRGLDPDYEVKGGNDDWLSRIYPDDRERIQSEVAQQDSGDMGFKTTEYRERHTDGRWIWILSRGKTIERLPDGKPARIVGTDTDITGIKTAEERLQFANTLLTTAMETSPDAILVVDADSRITSFNKRFADMWRIPLDALEAGSDAPVLAAVTSSMLDPEAFVARVRYLYEHPEEDGHDELETRDGRFIDRHTGALRTPSGQYLGRVWFFRDITARKAAEAQILRTARTDALTGLANRAVFMEAIARAIATGRRSHQGFAVLYLDLDHFKDVNDTLGHPIGDELLKAVAGRLCANTRASDIVARFGGDEFAVMISDVDDPDDAAAMADKLLAAMRDPFIVVGNDIHNNASIGISLSGPDGPDAEAMVSRADLALYRAKTEGPGVYRFFTDAMDTEVRTRVTLGSELHDAIPRGELFLLYQPQVDLATGLVCGVEALVRWRHPTRGILGPNEFIPLAEKSGLIASLGRWVMREACTQAKAWQEAGIAPGVVGVNLSAVQFKRSLELERDITAILAETGLAPRMLELELTETVLMAASIEHNDVLERLRDIGVRLAIDDFGVGYSSLDYLRRFPVDRIKIPLVFVEQIATVPGCAAIVRATLGLARELGIEVIAEGIELPEQLELLNAWGCRQGQGCHFSMPLSVADLTPILMRRRVSRGQPVRARTAA